MLEACDTLIYNGTVIPIVPERSVLRDGAVAVSDGRIVAVAPSGELRARFDTANPIDAGGGFVHPGLIECHMHITYLLFRWGFPDTTSWPEYLGHHGQYWDHITDEDEYWGSALGAIEMLRNGSTCYLESGTVLEPDAAARASEDVGIRAILGDPFIMDRGASLAGRRRRISSDRGRAFSLMGTQLTRNGDADALVRGHVALRGLGSASDELLLAAKDLADRNGVVFNQHQSFNEDDVAEDDQLRGRHCLAHLGEIGVLGANCTWSHMNVMRADELRPVIESRMSAVWCPTASMLLGLGAVLEGRHVELHRAGANVCLGSDSGNSCGRFDVFDQAYIALLGSRDRYKDRVLDAWDVLEMATIRGARAVGLVDRIGSIEVGKRADLVIHYGNASEAAPGIDPARQLAFSSRSRTVRTVLVDGRIVLRDGRIATMDEDIVVDRARTAAFRLLDNVGRTRDGTAVDTLTRGS